MPRITRLAAATLGAVALATAFCLPAASDARTNGPAAQRPAALSAGAIQLGPAACQEVQSAGKTVKRCSAPLRVTLAAAESSGAAAPQATGGCNNLGNDQNCEYKAFPRVTCGGYNGWVDWYDNQEGTYYIGTYGEAWDTCGDTTYVYLSWKQNMGLDGGNDLAGTASDFKTVGINYSNISPGFYTGGVSNVQVTVCSNWAYGWHCGTPYPV